MGPRLQTGSFPQSWPFLFSGQIWRTEDMKTSVPGLTIPEEPSAQPPSPRGTYPTEGARHPCLARSSSALPSCSCTQGYRAQGNHRVSLDVAKLGRQSTVYCKLLVGCEASWRSPIASWSHHAGTSKLWDAPWTCEQWWWL